MIAWATIGLMLSVSLPGCAKGKIEPLPSPRVVAVKVDPPKPPADLLACPEPPRGFPEGSAATIPAPVRSAIVRMAKSLGATSAQLRRLIEWHAPGSCKGSTAR